MENIKQVVLIGKFSKFIEEFMTRLEPMCQVQLCPVNVQILKNLLDTMMPKLFFFIFPAEATVSKEIFALLLSMCPDTPVIIIGKPRDEDILSGTGYLSRRGVSFLFQPIDMNRVEKSIKAILNPKAAHDMDDGTAREPFVGKQRTVMLVDDSPQFIYSMQRILSRKYKVTFVTSGLDVLPAIAKNRPDIILLDYEMPVCNGQQTLEILRSDDSVKDIPVIFLSGVADKKNIMDVMPLKPQGYMLKSSCSEDRLFEIIEEVLGKTYHTIDKEKK